MNVPRWDIIVDGILVDTIAANDARGATRKWFRRGAVTNGDVIARLAVSPDGQRPCSLIERGNGFPRVGGLVVEPRSGEMWRVVSIDSGVQTGDRIRGEANYVLATVTRAADVDDDAESTCSVRFDR